MNDINIYIIYLFFLELSNLFFSLSPFASQGTHILGEDVAPVAAETACVDGRGGAGCLATAAVHHSGAAGHLRDAWDEKGRVKSIWNLYGV